MTRKRRFRLKNILNMFSGKKKQAPKKKKQQPPRIFIGRRMLGTKEQRDRLAEIESTPAVYHGKKGTTWETHKSEKKKKEKK